VARGTSAVLGALTVVGVYWLAKPVRGERAALIAAGLATGTYLLVRESHFAVNDALVTLAVTAALVGCVRVSCQGARRDYVAAGAAVGLAFAAKYQAAAVGAPLLLAHLLSRGPRRWTDLALGLGVALVTALLAFPSLVLEPGRVLADVYVFDVLPARLGYDGIDPSGGYAYYAQALGVGIGWPMLALACIGAARAVVRREGPLLVIASLPVLLFAVMGASHMYFARFLLPAIPPTVVLAAVVVDELARSARVAAALVVVITVAWTVSDSVRFDDLLTRPDTRTQARAWIAAQLPHGARVAVDAPPLSVPMSLLPQDAVTSVRLYDAMTVDAYRQEGVEYVVTSSFTSEARPIDPERDARRRDFYAVLEREAQPVAQFRPFTGSPPGFVYDRIYGPFDSLAEFEQPGPTITIFRLA
jgi:4-amino-4-deoxy-L-arabinose transferase-like glycosyltransferase